MSKEVRKKVFAKYGGKCAYCGVALEKGWHIDHIVPERKMYGRKKFVMEEIANYNPSCASCNILKGPNTLKFFRVMIQSFIGSLNRYSTQYKFAKKFGLVSENNIDVKFYFERFADVEVEE